MNVRENTTGRDRHRTEKLGEFLVVTNRQLNVSRHDAALLVIPARVTREFEHFRAQIFLRRHHITHPSISRPNHVPRVARARRRRAPHQHRRQVHRRARAHARGVLPRLQVSRHPTDRELESRLGGSARRLLRALSLASSGHRSNQIRVAFWRRLASPARGRGRAVARVRGRTVRAIASFDSFATRRLGVRDQSFLRSCVDSPRVVTHRGRVDGLPASRDSSTDASATPRPRPPETGRRIDAARRVELVPRAGLGKRRTDARSRAPVAAPRARARRRDARRDGDAR